VHFILVLFNWLLSIYGSFHEYFLQEVLITTREVYRRNCEKSELCLFFLAPWVMFILAIVVEVISEHFCVDYSLPAVGDPRKK